MTRDDVIRSTAAHIRRVGELLADTTHELTRRAVLHDASKWSPDEWPAFEDATPKLAGLTYGSDEYKAALASIRPAIVEHYRRNSHHPEHYTGLGPENDGINGMNLLDLIEMLCDWKAAGERHDNGSMVRSIEINRDRFKIGPQLEKVLVNTAIGLGWYQETPPPRTVEETQ
jgi:hypothetical protein